MLIIFLIPCGRSRAYNLIAAIGNCTTTTMSSATYFKALLCHWHSAIALLMCACDFMPYDQL
ncbi:unnamed protein product, partial [Ceratitis capitata]